MTKVSKVPKVSISLRHLARATNHSRDLAYATFSFCSSASSLSKNPLVSRGRILPRHPDKLILVLLRFGCRLINEELNAAQLAFVERVQRYSKLRLIAACFPMGFLQRPEKTFNTSFPSDSAPR